MPTLDVMVLWGNSLADSRLYNWAPTSVGSVPSDSTSELWMENIWGKKQLCLLKWLTYLHVSSGPEEHRVATVSTVLTSVRGGKWSRDGLKDVCGSYSKDCHFTREGHVQLSSWHSKSIPSRILRVKCINFHLFWSYTNLLPYGTRW